MVIFPCDSSFFLLTLGSDITCTSSDRSICSISILDRSMASTVSGSSFLGIGSIGMGSMVLGLAMDWREERWAPGSKGAVSTYAFWFLGDIEDRIDWLDSL